MSLVECPSGRRVSRFSGSGTVSLDRSFLRLRGSGQGAASCAIAFYDFQDLQPVREGNALREGRKRGKQPSCWPKPPGKTRAVGVPRPKKMTDPKHGGMRLASNTTRPSAGNGWLSLSTAWPTRRVCSAIECRPRPGNPSQRCGQAAGKTPKARKTRGTTGLTKNLQKGLSR